jgi:dihydrodipicolinate synthase/N-acetylneuraminate lyase
LKPLIAQEIRGTWATLLTPINDDDSIEFSKLSDEIDYLTGAGVDGIYSNGTAGEFYAQSEAEFDRINQMLAEKCERTRMPFQIGASFMSAQIALERAKRAAQLKPSAMQITLPDWSPVTLEEAMPFCKVSLKPSRPCRLCCTTRRTRSAFCSRASSPRCVKPCRNWPA